jgi:hypothetical protein
MIEHTLRHTLPAAYALLPAPMASPAASTMLLAIGLQESKFLARRQGGGGPARGFWQFERGHVAGVLKAPIAKRNITGVLRHPATAEHIARALRHLRYGGAVGNATACHAIVEHNDTVACVFARLLLWTLPERLPRAHEVDRAWQQYVKAWRPGKPHRETWTSNYAEAWHQVEALTSTPSS